MTFAEIKNITCASFLALTDAEQLLFVLGVANGRGMTAGMFDAYAGAAKDMAGSSAERTSIDAAVNRIRAMMAPLLGIDVASLLNGLRAAAKRPELRDRFAIDALAAVHLDAARALRDSRS